MPIANRPHNLAQYVEESISSLDLLLAEREKAKDLVRKHHSGGYYMLRSWLRYGTDGSDAADDISGMDYVADMLDRHLPLREVRDNLDSVRKFGGDFMKYVLSPRQYSTSVDGRYMACFDILETAEAGAAEYGYVWRDPENEQDEDFVAARGLLEGCLALRNVVNSGQAVLEDIWSKFSVQMELRAMGYNLEKWRPKHEETELLWHASAFASELVKEGFSERKPDDRRGLGLYGEQTGISFTHEPKIAYAIAAGLRELWAVAHGHLDAMEIAGRLYSEGLERDSIRQTLGLAKYPEELETVEETAKLYNVYLWIGKQRENPVFTNVERVVEILKDRELSDIGVVLCEVRLNGDEQYKIAESEFIVNPGSILSVATDPDDPGPEAVGMDRDLESRKELSFQP